MNGFSPTSIDHVALWVADRDSLANLLCDHLGMHVIERSDDFTLVGADARAGKLTLFAAEGPREPGVLGPVVLRVRDLEAALDRLPREISPVLRDGIATFAFPEGLRLGLTVSNRGESYDLDHIILRVPDPERTAVEMSELGFERRDGVLAVADREVRLEVGEGQTGAQPLLNHLALLVDSAKGVKEEAERRGLEIDKVVDAENTVALFVRGPEGIMLEYIEHKPGFSLR